jgi:hypothetical protein
MAFFPCPVGHVYTTREEYRDARDGVATFHGVPTTRSGYPMPFAGYAPAPAYPVMYGGGGYPVGYAVAAMPPFMGGYGGYGAVPMIARAPVVVVEKEPSPKVYTMTAPAATPAYVVHVPRRELPMAVLDPRLMGPRIGFAGSGAVTVRAPEPDLRSIGRSIARDHADCDARSSTKESSSGTGSSGATMGSGTFKSFRTRY